MVVIMKSSLIAPVPDGYTLERVLELLRATGHEPVAVEDEEGNITPIADMEAA